MRIMIDTNILISIIIFDSIKLKKLLEIICSKHILVLSNYIIQELKMVVLKKFKDKENAIEEFLLNLPFELEYFFTMENELLDVNLRDKKDIPILYSAIASDVDIFITGDKDFENIKINRPKIMSVNEFLEKYDIE